MLLCHRAAASAAFAAIFMDGATYLASRFIFHKNTFSLHRFFSIAVPSAWKMALVDDSVEMARTSRKIFACIGRIYTKSEE